MLSAEAPFDTNRLSRPRENWPSTVHPATSNADSVPEMEGSVISSRHAVSIEQRYPSVKRLDEPKQALNRVNTLEWESLEAVHFAVHRLLSQHYLAIARGRAVFLPPTSSTLW